MRQEGRKEGLQEGLQKGRINTISDFIKGGYSIEEAKRVFKASDEEIQKAIKKIHI